MEALHEREHIYVWHGMVALGKACVQAKRLDEAQHWYEAVLTILEAKRSKVGKERKPQGLEGEEYIQWRAEIKRLLGDVLQRRGEFQHAAQQFRGALGLLRAIYGPLAEETLECHRQFLAAEDMFDRDGRRRRRRFNDAVRGFFGVFTFAFIVGLVSSCFGAYLVLPRVRLLGEEVEGQRMIEGDNQGGNGAVGNE